MLRIVPLLVLHVVAELSSSCLGAPAPDLSDAERPQEPELLAYDARGQPAALDAVPRRPRLRVTLQTQPSADTDAPWLFAGECDPALLRDLDQLPLNAAHQARKVEVRHRWDGYTVETEPRAELRKGQVYTLALPRTAAKALRQPFTAELRVDDSPRSGAAVRGTFPPAQSAAVPVGLAYTLITFDGETYGAQQGAWLEDPDGFAHPTLVEQVDCESYDSAAVSCIQLRLTAPLRAASRYGLRTGRALTDAHGAPLQELHASFRTSPDDTAVTSSWQRAACGIDEVSLPVGCALVRDDRVSLRLFPNAALRVTGSLAGQSFAVLPSNADRIVQFAELAPATTYQLSLQTYDGHDARNARNATNDPRPQTYTLTTTQRLPTLAITEVYADPNGREPDQEYVELWNYGDAPVIRDNLLLSDSLREPGSPLPEISLQPKARALLVADEYDPTAALDVAPAAGTLLLRAGKSLTRGGLANAGESLYLRTSDAQRLSSSPDRPTPRPGHCLVRTGDDPRSDGPENFALLAEGCSPGY